MPRASEIAADARALYGPPAVRPAAGAMGDGALWVDPGDNQSVWQVQSGNWVHIALPAADVDTDDDSGVPAGVPVLRGPYVVSSSDLTADGATKPLWTPEVGDVILALFADDNETDSFVPPWAVAVGQNMLGSGVATTNVLMWLNQTPSDMIAAAAAGTQNGGGTIGTAYHYVCFNAAPIQAMLTHTFGDGSGAPAQGNYQIYALLARAVAP